MYTVKQLVALSLSVLSLLAFSGCNLWTGTEEPQIPEGCGQQTYLLSEETNQLKLLGRTYAEANGIACDHTASGIEFKAYIQGELRIYVEASGDTYFTVYVDGQRLQDRYQAKGQTEIRIGGWKDAEKLALHTFCIVKQTESSWSTAKLISMDFYGKLAGPAPNKDLYIEFIGDSLSCGYGNLWTAASPHSSAEAGTSLYEDGTLAYPYLTAETLKADVSVIAHSGIGVDLGWTNPDGNGLKMMDFYKMRTYSRGDGTEYEFASARIPDIVVINLGVNDTALRSPEGNFKSGVADLIQYIRTAYGAKIPIVWIYGMGDGTAGWVQTVLRELGGEQEALYMVQLKPDSSGGNGHPSRNAHKAAAAQLTFYLHSIGLAS